MNEELRPLEIKLAKAIGFFVPGYEWVFSPKIDGWSFNVERDREAGAYALPPKVTIMIGAEGCLSRRAEWTLSERGKRILSVIGA